MDLKDQKLERDKVKQCAMRQLRATRTKFYNTHPDLFEALEVLAEKLWNYNADRSCSLRIDKDKNVRTVMRFLEIKQSQSLNHKIRMMIR